MGASIHYKGRMTNPTCINELRRYLLRFADNAKWECLDLTGQDESEILELILYPPGHCEPVFFLFDSEGRLHPPYPYQPSQETREESLWCSVRTRFGPLETHVQVVELLSQIQRDYLPELEVSDERSYWKREDLDSLRPAREFLARN